MIKLLVTGKKGYIGTNFRRWLEKFPDEYSVETLDLRKDSWVNKDFSFYDVVMHSVGIAHEKETKANIDLFYNINRDLAYKVAEKCENEGVKHFIFLSSMDVYGVENGIIDKFTRTEPITNYGRSKLQAEELIRTLATEDFKISIIRSPMVYGKGCKGHYQNIANIARKFPLLPYVNNRQSMIFIENLCEYIRVIIDDRSAGIFLPQNAEYVNTSEMIRLIAKMRGRELKMIKVFAPLLKKLPVFGVKKIFGDLAYEKCFSDSTNLKGIDFIDFYESIKLIEVRNS